MFQDFHAGNCALELVPLDGQLFQGTMLQHWWTTVAPVAHNVSVGQPVKARYLYSALTNALRYTLVWRYGGTYIDFDILLFRSLASFNNFVAYEQPNQANSALMKFNQGHPILGLTLYYFLRAWEPTVWATTGPKLITEMLHRWRSVNPGWLKEWDSVEQLEQQDWDLLDPLVVHVFPSQMFYPIHWSKATSDDLMKARNYQPQKHEAMLRGSYAHHVWTAQVHGRNPVKAEPGLISEFEQGSLNYKLLFPEEDRLVFSTGAEATNPAVR